MRGITCFALCFALLCTVCAQAPEGMAPDVKFEKVPVREALDKVLKPLKIAYEIKPEVKGNVTVKVKHQHLLDLMRDIMLQVNAIYDIDEGKYVIRPMKPALPATRYTMSPKMFMERVDYEHADALLAIKEVLGQFGVKYEVAPEIRGTVSLYLRRQPVDVVLMNIIKQVDARYRTSSAGVDIITLEEFNRLQNGPPPPRLP